MIDLRQVEVHFEVDLFGGGCTSLSCFVVFVYDCYVLVRSAFYLWESVWGTIVSLCRRSVYEISYFLVGLCEVSKPATPEKIAEFYNLSISKSAFIGEESVFLLLSIIDDVTSLSAELGSLLLLLLF